MVTICTASLTFNNPTFCPHSCIYVFYVDLRTNSDYFPIQHKLIGFYNPNEKCLMRGTDWVLNYSSHIRPWRPPVTAKAWIRFQVSPYEMCGGQSDTGTGFPPSTLVFLCQYYSANARYSSPICCFYQDVRTKPGNLRKSHNLYKIGEHLTNKCWHILVRALKTAYTCAVYCHIANNWL